MSIIDSSKDDKPDAKEGPIKNITIDDVPKEPRALYDGFDWVTVDLEDKDEVRSNGTVMFYSLRYYSSKRCMNSLTGITSRTRRRCLGSTIVPPS